MDELEDYIQQSEDATLLKWWAAYLESTERFDKATKYYGKAGDYLSLVRIACFKVQWVLYHVHSLHFFTVDVCVIGRFQGSCRHHRAGGR